jgi:hypothetical protein
VAPSLGLILTHSPDLATLRRALSTCRADALKVIPAWGLDGGWSPAAIAEAAHMVGTLVVRTSHGDPSYAHGARPYPHANQILDELSPWLRARPDAWIELGNEPLNGPAPLDPHSYAYHLGQAIEQCRNAYPRARLLAPAFSLNTHTPEIDRWLAILAPAMRRCDGVAIHAYTPGQLRLGLDLARAHTPGKPVWVTELNLGEALPAHERGRRIWELVRDAPVATALLYHLDISNAPVTAEQGLELYRLAPDTLAALAMRDDSAPPAVLGGEAIAPDAVAYPDRLPGGPFALDIRQWRTVAAFRRHLAAHQARQVAPWARGVTIHCTESPLPSTWAGVRSILGMARFYRDNPERRWRAGPHLFVVSGARNPAHDGVWQMTPLNLQGVHAAAFNSTHWGLEVVGAFDRLPWDPGTAGLVLGATAALLDWAGLETGSVNAHRDDPGTSKGCPGAMVDMAAVRRGVAALRGA